MTLCKLFVGTTHKYLTQRLATRCQYTLLPLTQNEKRNCYYSTCRICSLTQNKVKIGTNSRCFSQESSEFGKLLYVGRDQKRLKWTLGAFYSLSAVVAAASPFLLKLKPDSLVATGLMSFQILVFVVLNPIGLYQFGKRYVSELYHKKDTDTYTAVMLSPVVFGKKRITFNPKECRMPANPSIFTSFYVNKHPLFINSDTMNYSAYMKMLRYASDFDYENPDRQAQYSESINKAVENKQKEQKKEK